MFQHRESLQIASPIESDDNAIDYAFCSSNHDLILCSKHLCVCVNRMKDSVVYDHKHHSYHCCCRKLHHHTILCIFHPWRYCENRVFHHDESLQIASPIESDDDTHTHFFMLSSHTFTQMCCIVCRYRMTNDVDTLNCVLSICTLLFALTYLTTKFQIQPYIFWAIIHDYRRTIVWHCIGKTYNVCVSDPNSNTIIKTFWAVL